MGFFFGRTAMEEPDGRGRVFTWAKDKRLWMHFSAFLFFSALVHWVGFYLFKVVYPPPVQVVPEPDSILVMSPADPATRAVLQRLSDRTVYLLPPSTPSDVRVRLESHRVRFTPSFQRAGLELLPPPSLLAGPGPIEPLPVTPVTGDGVRGVGSVRVKLAPSLTDRPLAPWSIFHDYLDLADDLPSIRLSIEIAPDGRVRVAAVEAALEEEEKRELTDVVESTLRFLPASEAAKGWIELGGG